MIFKPVIMFVKLKKIETAIFYGVIRLTLDGAVLFSYATVLF